MENGMAPVGMRRQATKAISTNHNAREVATIRVHALASSFRCAQQYTSHRKTLGKIIPRGK